MFFGEAFNLIYDEDIEKKSMIDNNKRISLLKFMIIAKTHFYEEDTTKNKYAQFHSIFFQQVAKSCLNRWHVDQIECCKFLIIIFSLFKGTKLSKLDNFLKLSIQFLSPDIHEKISTKRLTKVILFYLEYSLIYFTRLIININKTIPCQKSTLLIRRLKLFVNNNNITNFLTLISPYLNPAHEENFMTIEEIKEKLMKSIYIFDLFELHQNFISIIKERTDSKEQYNLSIYNYIDLEDEYV